MESDAQRNTMTEPVSQIEDQAEPWSPAALERMLRALGEDVDCALEEGTRKCGPFTLLEEIGKGGFGVVYAAAQDSPVKRRVAVKIMREGMASEDVLRRFALEQRALARIDHPCVATILEAGTTEEGTPWFAMPLIDGAPITKVCAEAKSSLRERTRLIAQVCEGVHAAHVQGIIHRDLKPANILAVEQADGHLSPKVIDFGIAKAIDPEAADDIGVTRTGHGRAAGTLAYMAPEQVDAVSPRADVRTDVFSLGIVLCELLSGARPAASGPMSRLGPLRLHQAMIETEVDHKAAARQARLRARIAPQDRALLADIDAIVSRATMPEPELRYQSAEAMAQDLHRALRSEPVLARPPRASYVLSRLIRRHRGVAIAAASGLSATIVLAIVALTAAARARANEAEALIRGTRLEQVSGMLAGMFEQVGPDEGGAADTALLLRMLNATAVQALEKAAETDETVTAGVAETICDAFIRFDHPERAHELAQGLLAALEERPQPALGKAREDYFLSKARLLNLRGKAHSAIEARKTGAGSPVGDLLPAWNDWRQAYWMLESEGLGESKPAVLATLYLWGHRTGRNEGDWEHHAIQLDTWLDEHMAKFPETALERWSYQLSRAQFTDFNGIFRQYPTVLAQFERAFGSKHPSVIRARLTWMRHAVVAVLEGQVFTPEEMGIPQLRGAALATHWAETERFGEQLNKDAIEILGPDHTKTFAARIWHLAAVGHGRGVEDAKPLYERLCADLAEANPLQPEILTQAQATWRGIVEGPRESLWWRGE